MTETILLLNIGTNGTILKCWHKEVLTVILFGWPRSAVILLRRHRQVKHVVIRRYGESGHNLRLLEAPTGALYRLHTDHWGGQPGGKHQRAGCCCQRRCGVGRERLLLLNWQQKGRPTTSWWSLQRPREAGPTLLGRRLSGPLNKRPPLWRHGGRRHQHRRLKAGLDVDGLLGGGPEDLLQEGESGGGGGRLRAEEFWPLWQVWSTATTAVGSAGWQGQRKGQRSLVLGLWPRLASTRRWRRPRGVLEQLVINQLIVPVGAAVRGCGGGGSLLLLRAALLSHHHRLRLTLRLLLLRGWVEGLERLIARPAAKQEYFLPNISL